MSESTDGIKEIKRLYELEKLLLKAVMGEAHMSNEELLEWAYLLNGKETVND